MHIIYVLVIPASACVTVRIVYSSLRWYFLIFCGNMWLLLTYLLHIDSVHFILLHINLCGVVTTTDRHYTTFSVFVAKVVYWGHHQYYDLHIHTHTEREREREREREMCSWETNQSQR